MAASEARALVALEKCEAAIRRLATRLDAEPGNQTAVALWLHLADEAKAALADPRPPVTREGQGACVHGHTTKQAGCVSCELLWRHSSRGGQGASSSGTPEGLCTACSATQYCAEHEPPGPDAAGAEPGERRIEEAVLGYAKELRASVSKNPRGAFGRWKIRVASELEALASPSHPQAKERKA